MGQEIRINITVDPAASENVRLEWDGDGGEEIDAHIPRGTHDKVVPFRVFNDNSFPLEIGLAFEASGGGEGEELPCRLDWHNKEVAETSDEGNALIFSVPKELPLGASFSVRIFPPWGPWPPEN